MVRPKLVYLVVSHTCPTSGNPVEIGCWCRRDYDPGVTPKGTKSIEFVERTGHGRSDIRSLAARISDGPDELRSDGRQLIATDPEPLKSLAQLESSAAVARLVPCGQVSPPRSRRETDQVPFSFTCIATALATHRGEVVGSDPTPEPGERAECAVTRCDTPWYSSRRG